MQIPMASQIKYLIRRHEELTMAKDAIDRGNLESIESMGHKWKGNGATFGFPELGKLGELLESAAAQNKIDEVRALMSQFETWLTHHPVPQSH